MTIRSIVLGILTFLSLTLPGVAAAAQQDKPAKATSPAVPPGYVIGAADVLTVVFWRDKDMSGDVTVRPDGMISLPLINEISAAGCTPDELRQRIMKAAARFVQDDVLDVTVVVKEIRSRNVFITGSVNKPATYPMNGEMTVLQLIAVAGGLQDWAKATKIIVVRTENGRQQTHRFNYNDVISEKNTAQNIALKPGDTVVVP